METYEGLWGEVNLDDLADTLVFSGIAFSRQKVHMLSDDCRLWKNFPGLSVDALQKIEENHVVPIDEKALKEIENGVWHSLFIQSLRQGQ
ncbi:hypothetical protein HY213_01425 [Candidatus Peregrinibacteria bacterium]|nr:hypothetical protein [Candidatus Peregrinibacteria bacterium]